MRALLVGAILLLLGPITGAVGETTPFRAGVARLSVAAATPFDVLVWYPTQAEEVPWQTGDFSIPASHDAAMAPGHFPIVLLSHGGGLTGGTPLILRELSADLARRGFLVVAPFHGKAGLKARPGQVKLALDDVLADSRFASNVDPRRLGMLGFSLGTAVTLELAGAVPNVAHLVSYCAAHPDDIMSCGHAPDGKNGPAPGQTLPVGTASAPSPLPLKAIVLLDPYAVLFQQHELTAVTMPVLVFRPKESELPGEANAFSLVAALPQPPQFQTVPGRHFIFTDVCPAPLQSSAPEVCQDPDGVDRAAVHAAVETQIARFFDDNL
jgi:predicted dienelactone hydrolase